jgi:hypothetical protein
MASCRACVSQEFAKINIHCLVHVLENGFECFLPLKMATLKLLNKHRVLGKPWKDSIARPIAPVSGGDTIRPHRQGNLGSSLQNVPMSHFKNKSMWWAKLWWDGLHRTVYWLRTSFGRKKCHFCLMIPTVISRQIFSPALVFQETVIFFAPSENLFIYIVCSQFKDRSDTFSSNYVIIPHFPPSEESISGKWAGWPDWANFFTVGRLFSLGSFLLQK